MRNFWYPLLIVLLSVIGLTACDNEDDYDAVFVEMVSNLSPTYITQPDSTTQYKYYMLYSGSSYRFTLNAREAKGGSLSRLTINSFDRERGNVAVLDTALTGSSASFEWIYTAPSTLVNDTLAITFTVMAYNTGGETCKREYTYTLVQQDAALTAIQGITMYAIEGDNKPNGFSFARQQAIRTSLSEDKEIDIYAYTRDEDPETLTREWRTKNGIYFVKNNTFDYARATRRSVSAAFASSVPYHIVNGIAEDDVIIVGDSANAIGVIKVVSVLENNGAANDRYYFDFKPIRRK